MDEDTLQMLSPDERAELERLLDLFLEGVEVILPEGWLDWAIPGYTELHEILDTLREM